MKMICNKIMRLDTTFGALTDYSTIAFIMWIDEIGLLNKKKSTMILFNEYLYRFYIDNKHLGKNHPSFLIKNIEKYSPKDLLVYTEEILYFIQNRTDLFKLNDKEIQLLDDRKFDEKDLSTFKRVKKMMVKKYVPNLDDNYSSTLLESEYNEDSPRLFNRIIEKINYCFVCEENDVQKLKLIQLKKNTSLTNKNNYLVLCANHAHAYKSGQLVINKNGYPYTNGKRLFNHLEIRVLKTVRPFLDK